MKQLTQNLKTGKMELLEVPYPSFGKGMVLVRTHYSLISAGTEGSKVSTARKGYIGKAKEKPEAVKQVLDSVKTEGIVSTYHKVMNKLDAPAPLGYSASGVIIEVAEDVTEFKVGDLVACAGLSAGHADVIAIPKNLCAKAPDGVSAQAAAYTTVASIALQGIRQADLRLGETCAVIGLGLIGQLTVQMLKASGIDAIGIDIDPAMVDMAKKSGAEFSFTREDPGLEDGCLRVSDGHGVDAVIITAGTSSLDPVELAGKICRKKGKVVIVGAVPTGFSRGNYYVKELSLLMSCSYGPGRYDADYEEKGLDYPIGYVRWTENRNMQAYLNLVANGSIDIDLLTSHTYDFDKALDAYEMIMAKSEPFVGILLHFDHEKVVDKKVVLSKDPVQANNCNIGFIGAGSFAQKFLLPNAKKVGQMIGVATGTGFNAKNIAEKYKFQYATGDYKEVAADKNIDTVFIATRHNQHAEQVLSCLKNDKNVFVEKPLCLSEAELEEIKVEYEKRNLHLMVGYNRRFAPQLQKIKKMFNDEVPKAINYRINSGVIPNDSWIQDKEIGGGRIIGEVCHFVDLAMYLSNSRIDKLSAFAMDDPSGNMDTLNVSVYFENGSIASISYYANGSKSLHKEYLEVFAGGTTAILDDFKVLNIYKGKKSTNKAMTQDKGHAKEVELFLNSIKDGTETPISFDQIYQSTLASLKIIEGIKTGDVQKF